MIPAPSSPSFTNSALSRSEPSSTTRAIVAALLAGKPYGEDRRVDRPTCDARHRHDPHDAAGPVQSLRPAKGAVLACPSLSEPGPTTAADAKERHEVVALDGRLDMPVHDERCSAAVRVKRETDGLVRARKEAALRVDQRGQRRPGRFRRVVRSTEAVVPLAISAQARRAIPRVHEDVLHVRPLLRGALDSTAREHRL